MNQTTTYTSTHLTATERIRLDHGQNHDTVIIGEQAVRLVLPHDNGAAQNAGWLRDLADRVAELAERVEGAAVAS